MFRLLVGFYSQLLGDAWFAVHRSFAIVRPNIGPVGNPELASAWLRFSTYGLTCRFCIVPACFQCPRTGALA